MTNIFGYGIILCRKAERRKKTISFIDKLFGQKRKNALVFVDYEHWHVSMYKLYSRRPEIKRWKNELDKKYNVVDMFFFGDFSNPGMRYEIPAIREVTNNVIETQNTSQHYKKDFTDFIMLDSIYQMAIFAKDIDTFIIFTGDGHFTSVVKFLTNTCKKNVVVYAVRDCLSGMLKNAASSYEEIPTDSELESIRISMVVNYLASQKALRHQRRYITFLSAMEAVAEKYNEDKETVREIMTKMLENGYIRQERKFLTGGKQLKALYLNEEKLKESNIEILPDEKLSQNEKIKTNRKKS